MIRNVHFDPHKMHPPNGFSFFFSFSVCSKWHYSARNSNTRMRKKQQISIIFSLTVLEEHTFVIDKMRNMCKHAHFTVFILFHFNSTQFKPIKQNDGEQNISRIFPIQYFLYFVQSRTLMIFVEMLWKKNEFVFVVTSHTHSLPLSITLFVFVFSSLLSCVSRKKIVWMLMIFCSPL